VNYTVEPIYNGQESSLERLYFEVWTDGTVSTADAISQSAQILLEQFSPFANYTQLSQVESAQEPSHPAISNELFNMPVEQLNLSVRTMNCLRRGGIATVGELASKRVQVWGEKQSKGNQGRRRITGGHSTATW
jgi:DNA-directed RNA polymerase subunit alpha